MKRLPALILVLCFLNAHSSFAQTTLRLNEFMASNGGSSIDPDFGVSGDWIELYNYGNETISLTGLFLSNDFADATRWPFPVGTQIGPGEYILIWADEANILLHTNFQLDISGGQIGIFDANGNAIDSIIYGSQKTDVSFGLLNNVANVWRYLGVATPGAANDATGFIGFTQPVTFSSQGGFYSTTQTVTLSTAGQGTIHYTTDGSSPTEASPVYTTPLSVGASVVLRAAAFQTEFLSSVVNTQTYLINQPTELPVFAISMNPADLFSDSTGIYVEGTNGIPGNCAEAPRNWNQDWEKVANVEFFEVDGSSVLNQQAGIKISGGCSRNYDQKSLALFARQEYGSDTFDYAFFPDREIQSFKTLELRNSGQDWFRTMFRDGFIHTLLGQHEGMNVLAYRPAIVFLNGQYWGIHNIRELLDASYLVQNYDAALDQIDLLEGQAAPIEGSADAYNEMLEFIRNSDMTNDQTLVSLDALMDIDQFMDYQAAEIFIANADWPSSNIKFWRSQAGDNRWRWIVFDTDLAFGGNENGQPSTNTLFQATDPAGPDWPNPPALTELLRSLLENDGFKQRFAQRIASHINITFDSTHVNQVIDSLAANIASEVPRHEERWEESIGFFTPWEAHIGSLTGFSNERQSFLRSQVADQFGYNESSTLEVTVNEPGRGRVFVSDVELRSVPFAGDYFSNIPIEIRAEPLDGYMFTGWAGGIESSDDALSVVISSPTSIQAVFEETMDTTPTEDFESPYQFGLGANYPNPFSTQTTLPFEIDAPSQVQIRLFDLLGREVIRLRDEFLTSGAYKQTIHASYLSSGLYMVELSAGTQVERRTVMVVR